MTPLQLSSVSRAELLAPLTDRFVGNVDASLKLTTPGGEFRFDRAIAEFGIAYADLAEADCAAFKFAVENLT